VAFGSKKANSPSSAYLRHGITSAVRRLARGLLVSSDRNWLEFLSVLDATFSYLRSEGDDAAKEKCSQHISETRLFLSNIAEEDGSKDRSATLALVELAKRTVSHGLDQGSSAVQLRRMSL
jgi:N-terminal acetyltransferase B complex non-catalytic subunit